MVALISGQTEIIESVQQGFNESTENRDTLRVLSTTDAVTAYLNFELPEIVIIDCSDAHIQLSELITIIQTDSWLHSFGIIGLFDRKQTNEEKLLTELSEINLLAVYDYQRARLQLPLAVDVIRENHQLIFQHDLSRKLVMHVSASFIIQNNPILVPIYAGLATVSLAHHGLIESDRRVQLQIVLTELLLNAIEHGNCEITMEEKAAYLAEGGTTLDLVDEKCMIPAVQERVVHFSWETHDDFTRFRIRDEGKGFDVEAYREKIIRNRIDALNGRGIMMARKLASRLAYNKKGNKVLLEFPHYSGDRGTAPTGFENEEILTVSRGEIVFKEGEQDDYLYYIISGTYVVYHKGEKVGTLSPSDIFMGEMSFLLNYNRNATVMVETGGRLIRIPRERFVGIIRKYPHYGLFLARLLARKLANSNKIHAEHSAMYNR